MSDEWQNAVVRAQASQQWVDFAAGRAEQERVADLLAGYELRGDAPEAVKGLRAQLATLRKNEVAWLKTLDPAIVATLEAWHVQEQERRAKERAAFHARVEAQEMAEKERKLSAARQKLAEAQREIVELEGQE